MPWESVLLLCGGENTFSWFMDIAKVWHQMHFVQGIAEKIMGQLLICQHICKKIMYVQHQIYPSSASFNVHSYRRTIHLLWHLKYSEQSSIHLRFKRECGKVRGQMEIAECKINIATCHWTNQQMYNTRFMASALEQKEFTGLTQNISFKQYEEFSAEGSTRKIRTVRLVSRKHLQAPRKRETLVGAIVMVTASIPKQGYVVPDGSGDSGSRHHGGQPYSLTKLQGFWESIWSPIRLYIIFHIMVCIIFHRAEHCGPEREL